MSRGPDVGRLLQRAVAASADRAGLAVSVAATGSEGWASATFTGARHRLTIAGPDSAELGRWLADLSDADLPVRGHLVADLLLCRVRHDGGRTAATLEVLTVEDGP